MKRFKKIATVLIIATSIGGVIYGVGYIKFKVWRAEHPQAKTWTFFIIN